MGSIIFLLVASTLTLGQVSEKGVIGSADLFIKGPNIGDTEDIDKFLFANDTDSVLIKYKDDIKNFAYVSGELKNSQNRYADTCFSGHARMSEDGKDVKDQCTSVQAIAPSSLLDDNIELLYYDRNTGLSPTE